MGLNLDLVLIEYYEAVAKYCTGNIVTIKVQYILPLLDYIHGFRKDTDTTPVSNTVIEARNSV